VLLAGKICIVTGAGSPRGIGFSTAQLFAEHGATVIVADRSMDESVIGKLRARDAEGSAAFPQIHGIRCDITDPDDCRYLIDNVAEQFGRIDCLVNSAGLVETSGMLDIGDDALERMLAVNLKGLFRLCRNVIDVFSRQQNGVIINLASAAAQRGGGLVGGAHYAAAKGGVISLTKAIAREFGPQGIRANVICPAMIETSMLDLLPADRYNEIIDAIPLRRTGLPKEVAGTCLFLASELSGYMTGATLDVNGGSHIH
jgi:NAD(P)-dependent dehydrogenase (short-subunit alcohol dehydrogenase family)